MSHETIIADLNALSKARAYNLPPEDYAAHVGQESARSAIILTGSIIEHFITERLENMMPSLNSDETNRIFGAEGPLGTFANKTRVAQGLGIIDRKIRKKIDICRAMRNAAAHCVTPINFDLPVIKSATVQIMDPANRKIARHLQGEQVRHLFVLMGTNLIGAVMNSETAVSEMEILKQVIEIWTPKPSPDKPAE